MPRGHSMPNTARRLIAVAVAPLVFGVILIGCGSSVGVSPVSPSSAVTIVQSPSSVIVPIGSTTTFSVTAAGTGPLTYQWTRNGVPIAGAVNASYVTPFVTESDSGTQYEVSVANASSSAQSMNAILTVGARSPRSGDLRLLLYEKGDGLGLGTLGGQTSDLLSNSSAALASSLGSPLFLGSTFDCVPREDCAWPFSSYKVQASPYAYHTGYASDGYVSLSADLQSIATANTVIFSLDLEPANNIFAVAGVTATGLPAFDYKLEAVPASGVASAATQDGGQSRVITAASFDADGQVNLISYGWQGDTTTKYETQTMLVTGPNVQASAISLAEQGYIISAFGGNDVFGYVLIGTREQGDHLARPFTVSTNGGVFIPAVNATNASFTAVIQLNFVGGELLVTEQ